MNLIFKNVILGAVLIAASAPADDLSGSKRVLCSIQDVNLCQSDAGCAATLATELNIPQFIEVDTKTGMLATTAASGESRETAASQVSRSDDHLLIHGDQMGRAFSLLIQESTGQASFASIADGDAVVIFAACTPISD
jgi:hypothetical protein